MLAKTTLLCYNNYSDKERVIICVLKGILDVCFSVKSTQKILHASVGFYFLSVFILYRSAGFLKR